MSYAVKEGKRGLHIGEQLVKDGHFALESHHTEIARLMKEFLERPRLSSYRSSKTEIRDTMKVILTGATGYVGEGTLLELLKVEAVEKVLSVSRKPTGIKHEKLEEYLVRDFMALKEGDEHFKGYDAVFFIAGITFVGTPKDIYVRISQEIPLHFADIMPDKERMTYIYLSGAGTSPDGKQFWQQVKSKTEAD